MLELLPVQIMNMMANILLATHETPTRLVLVPPLAGGRLIFPQMGTPRHKREALAQHHPGSGLGFGSGAWVGSLTTGFG